MRLPFFDHRRLVIVLWHVGMIALSLAVAYLLRFEFSIPRSEIQVFYRGLWVALLVKTLIFYFSGLQRRWLWQFVDMVDLFQVFAANLFASLAFTAVALLLIGSAFPRSVYCIDFLLCFLLTAGARFVLRLYSEGVVGRFSKTPGKAILIYGAGVAGTMLVREIRSNPTLGYTAVGFLDDDPSKRDTTLLGVPVLGTGREAARIVERLRKSGTRVKEIVIAMPSADERLQQIQEVLANCRAAGVPCKTIPSHSELLSGKAPIARVQDLSINDLLGRKPIQLEEDRVHSVIAGRSILITGAAGSIGSELCLQVARFEPRRVVALDQSEGGLFNIDRELRKKFPTLDVVAEIGDIRDLRRTEEVLRRHSVDSVFHAAAYKHVPVMEYHVLEAVKNNILGTWNVAQAARRNRVSDFLMISSDKAVNPTNVMGATKRVAELIVSGMAGGGGDGETRFVSVRFGNVLGSSGSVVPIFQSQIAVGGPVTVTHPEARRYFMTVREAVQLVLQASSMGKGSEIFVLDMGEPIRILDLARNMIQLSGLVPDKDVEVRFIGLRPGEKICEELITQAEDLLPTYHEKIKVFHGPQTRSELIESWITETEVLLGQGDPSAVIAQLKRLVPEYRPSRVWSGADRRRVVQQALPQPILQPVRRGA